MGITKLEQALQRNRQNSAESESVPKTTTAVAEELSVDLTTLRHMVNNARARGEFGLKANQPMSWDSLQQIAAAAKRIETENGWVKLGGFAQEKGITFQSLLSKIRRHKLERLPGGYYREEALEDLLAAKPGKNPSPPLANPKATQIATKRSKLLRPPAFFQKIAEEIWLKEAEKPVS